MSPVMRPIELDDLLSHARDFAKRESSHRESSLFGVTDGKAVGTYLEHKFVTSLGEQFDFASGSSAKGIDLPSLGVDLKVTSIRQPQSSCPFKSARQKVFGLGYGLLVFVYDKSDDHEDQTARLDILHVVFIEQARTADFQLTRGILRILDNDGNVDDLVAFMHDKMLPVEEIQAREIAEEILRTRPNQGYLTISNALQWRLQYRRVIEQAGKVSGIVKVK
jgi:hypothetical protein